MTHPLSAERLCETECFLVGGVSGDGMAFRFLLPEDILPRSTDVSHTVDLPSFQAPKKKNESGLM
jgi:hypothetical protein